MITVPAAVQIVNVFFWRIIKISSIPLSKLLYEQSNVKLYFRLSYPEFFLQARCSFTSSNIWNLHEFMKDGLSVCKCKPDPQATWRKISTAGHWPSSQVRQEQRCNPFPPHFPLYFLSPLPLSGFHFTFAWDHHLHCVLSLAKKEPMIWLPNEKWNTISDNENNMKSERIRK